MQSDRSSFLKEQLPTLHKLVEWIPKLNENQRAVLYSRVEGTTAFDADFFTTMVLSSGIATIGLVMDNVAIIIGAMIVAPFMHPLIGAGLALVRGDVKLFKAAAIALVLGTVAGFATAILVDLVSFEDTLTLEIIKRGQPTLLDMFVALMAGAAAAYAIARPRVVASLAGVAVAAALVPPLASSGIAFASGSLNVARGAFILFLTNLIAIIAGSAWMFNLMAIRGMHEEGAEASPLWIRRGLLGVILFAVLLVAPLGYRTAEQINEGQIRPLGYPLTPRLEDLITKRVAEDPDVNIMLAGRSGQDTGPDVAIYLLSEKPISETLKNDLIAIVKSVRGLSTNIIIYAVKGQSWKSAPTHKSVATRIQTESWIGRYIFGQSNKGIVLEDPPQ